MTRYLVIANPVAGRGIAAKILPLVERKLAALGLDFEVACTGHPWHAAELAQGAVALQPDGKRHFDVVVAMGGDGTVNEVLNGLMLARQAAVGPVNVPPVAGVPATAVGQLPVPVALGVLCVGRGNDFAYGMDIPSDWERGCQILASGFRRTIDVGRVEGGLYPQGRYFGNGVGIGFDAVVGFVAARHKRLSGFPAYMVSALETISLYFQAPRVRIEFDAGGQPAFSASPAPIERAALMISVMNGRRMGGGFYMAPHASPEDGLFSLCIVRQVSRRRMFSLIPHFLKGTQSRQPEVQMVNGHVVSVTALEGTLAAHADGETICTAGSQLILELLPHSLDLLCERP